MSSEPDRRASATLIAVTLCLAGCRSPGLVFEPLDAPLRWPAAPQVARVEYLGQLATDRDLKPGVSLGAAIFGASPAQSMLSPYAVATDGGDRVFVSDSNAHLVHVFDLASRRYERWPADDGGTLAQPLGIAWDPAGRLLVADAASARIVAIDGAGVAEATIGAGLLERPSGVAVDPQTRRIFVADAAAHQVVVFDAAGALLHRIGSRGVEPGQFNYPTNVALDGRGRLHVADSLNFRVQVFGDDLAYEASIGGQGDRPGYFARPKGIALDADDHVYVVDAGFESVQIFDDAGRLLLNFGREGTGPGEFWLPAGIHIDADDRIWVADSYNRRVQVFRYLRGAE